MSLSTQRLMARTSLTWRRYIALLERYGKLNRGDAPGRFLRERREFVLRALLRAELRAELRHMRVTGQLTPGARAGATALGFEEAGSVRTNLRIIQPGEVAAPAPRQPSRIVSLAMTAHDAILPALEEAREQQRVAESYWHAAELVNMTHPNETNNTRAIVAQHTYQLATERANALSEALELASDAGMRAIQKARNELK